MNYPNWDGWKNLHPHTTRIEMPSEQEFIQHRIDALVVQVKHILDELEEITNKLKK